MSAKKKAAPPDWLQLDRAVLVDVCKDGTISYRERVKKEKRLNNAALPVYSVDTVEEARALQVHFGAKQYTEHPRQPGREWFVLPGFAGEIDALDNVSRCFDDFYRRVVEPKRLAPPEGSRWMHRRDRRVCVFERLRFFVVLASPIAMADYRYEPTAGDAPGRVRGRGNAKRSATPTQSMPFAEWREIFTRPAPELRATRDAR